MKRMWMALGALLLALAPGAATAQDKLVVSVWGGSWRDMVDTIIAKRFTAETGVPVEFITGGTIDRLNKERLAKGNPESDITFTTSHVGWLYANDGLYEKLDLSKIPNAANLIEQAKISPYHIGTWAYVYTIGYRSDLIKNETFTSWADLWKPSLKGKLAAPDFDPSHLIVVSAILSGGDASTWEKGQAKLKELKPNFKAFYTNDANSQQLIANGETPVQVILSMNAHYMAGEGVPNRRERELSDTIVLRCLMRRPVRRRVEVYQSRHERGRKPRGDAHLDDVDPGHRRAHRILANGLQRKPETRVPQEDDAAHRQRQDQQGSIIGV